MGHKHSSNNDWRSNEDVLRRHGAQPIAAGSLDTRLFTLNGAEFEAKCVKVYDGDTIHIVTSLHEPIGGRRTLRRFKCRLYGYDSAEMRTHDAIEKEAAIAARSALAQLVLDRIVIVKCRGEDKYGRLLIDCRIGDVDICKYMLENRLGVEYYGGTKTK